MLWWVVQGEAFSYTVPTRSAANQLYIEELDRIVLTEKVGCVGLVGPLPARMTLSTFVSRLQVSQRSFVNHREVRKAAITTRVIQLVHEVLDKVSSSHINPLLLRAKSSHGRLSSVVWCWQGIHITKRDMFYTDVKLFKQQARHSPSPSIRISWPASFMSRLTAGLTHV